MVDIRSLSLLDLEVLVCELGEKKFRAKQIFNWIHQKHVESFDEMTNISKDFRDKLKEKAVFSYVEIVKKVESIQDNTIKYLFAFQNKSIMEGENDFDGRVDYIEAVLMRYKHGNAVCVSTQIGCRMGCAFCASTIDGLTRNLTAGEITAQVYMISKDIGDRISNVVYMGSGEPLDNFENVSNSIYLLNSEEGVNIGQRHITLSTCGLVNRFDDLAELNLQITLAVSLHAPNDDIRLKLMPVAKKYSIEMLLDACFDYTKKTKRRITFEYALIDGINDKAENAHELAKRLKGMLCHVNIIPVNDVKERGFVKSSSEKIEKFAQILLNYHIETTIRRELGSDINAACGQLRQSHINNDKSN